MEEYSEGTFEQMKDSLDKILNLPDDTLVYCGHEYTMSNANFCKSLVYNNDEELDASILEIKNLRDEENQLYLFFLARKKLNPFLRYNDINFKIANNIQNSIVQKHLNILENLRIITNFIETEQSLKISGL